MRIEEPKPDFISRRSRFGGCPFRSDSTEAPLPAQAADWDGLADSLKSESKRRSRSHHTKVFAKWLAVEKLKNALA